MDIIFYQLFEHESSTYTYLLADPITKEAALIDSVIETFERDWERHTTAVRAASRRPRTLHAGGRG